MNAKELVRRWKDRQAQILGILPESVRNEYHELTVAIRRAEAEFAESKKQAGENGRSGSVPVQPPAPAPSQPAEDFGKVLEKMSSRVPLEERKRQVVKYLTEHGPSGRSDILRGSGIPNGSLSNVLLDDQLFEQKIPGIWTLKEREEEPPI